MDSVLEDLVMIVRRLDRLGNPVVADFARSPERPEQFMDGKEIDGDDDPK